MNESRLPFAAIELLRAQEEDLHSRAANAEKLSHEAWVDYKRRSDRARDLWRQHSEVLAGLRELEALGG